MCLTLPQAYAYVNTFYNNNALNTSILSVCVNFGESAWGNIKKTEHQ